MQDIVTARVLTHKEQAVLGPVGLARVPTHGACLAGVVGIDFDRHAPRQCSFVSKVAVQFSKSPLGSMMVCPSLLLAGTLSMLALRPFANMCQVLQANDGMWVLIDNAATDLVVAVSFQPSLSSADDDESPGSGASAFLLQPLSQSRIMVGFGSYAFARIEGRLILDGRRDGQIALADIDAHHRAVLLGRWILSLDLQGHQQVELFLGLVIPELSRPEMGTVLDQGHMVVVSGVGHDHSSIERQDAHVLVCLEAVIMAQLIGQGGRKERPFLPALKGQGILGRLGDNHCRTLSLCLMFILSFYLYTTFSPFSRCC